MKQWMSFAAAITLSAAISTSAFAHSPLTEATPPADATVVEPLEQITLQFNGGIEQGSYVDVVSSTGEVLQPAITIEDNALVGTFEEPIPNDTYTVMWNIISEDGHPLEGEYALTVDAPIVEQVVEEVVTEDADTSTVQEDENEVEAPKEEEVTGPSIGMLAGVGIGMLVLLGGVFYFVMRKD